MNRLFLLTGLMAGLTLLAACGSDSNSPDSSPQPPVSGDDTNDDPSGDSTSEARAIAELIRTPLADCPDRIWPSVVDAYGASQVLITDERSGEREAYLWQANNGDPQIETLNADTLADEWFEGYAFSEYRGQKTLGFDVGDWGREGVNEAESLWDTPLSTLFHESFHWFADTEWNTGWGGRDAEYPVRSEPRYLRAQLMLALKRALLNDEDLSAASYWYERYLADYTEEASRVRPVDISEGAARYADVVMVALAERGCDASEAAILDEVKANQPLTDPRLRAASESYVLGALAGTLLRERGTDGWHSRVEEGETLQGVLLDGVAPEEQPDDADLRATVQSMAESHNEELDQRLGDSLPRFESDDYHRLVIDRVNSVGSYRKGGTFLLVDQPLLEAVNLDVDGQFDQGATITLDSVDTFNVDGSPCEPRQAGPMLVLVPDSAISFDTDGTADLDTGPVRFSDLEVQTQVWNDIEWLCPLN